MNCASYIDNVVSRGHGHGDMMTQLNDHLTHDLQDLDATFSTMQDDFKRLVETAMAVDQTFHVVAHESDEMAAVTAVKNNANDAVLSAAARFADLE